MHFDTKSYLKSTRKHTVKHAVTLASNSTKVSTPITITKIRELRALTFIFLPIFKILQSPHLSP